MIGYQIWDTEDCDHDKASFESDRCPECELEDLRKRVRVLEDMIEAEPWAEHYFRKWREAEARLALAPEPEARSRTTHSCDIPGCVSCANPEEPDEPDDEPEVLHDPLTCDAEPCPNCGPMPDEPEARPSSADELKARCDHLGWGVNQDKCPVCLMTVAELYSSRHPAPAGGTGGRCERCLGTGESREESHDIDCPACGGTGQRRDGQ